MIKSGRFKTGLFSWLICALMVLFSGADGGNPGVQEILKKIDSCDPKVNRAELIELIGELWAPAARFVEDFDGFIDDDIMGNLELSTYEDRLDVIRILVPLINRKDKILTNEIAAAFSYYRYPPAKQMLSDYPDGPQKAIFYAILGHARSYLWAIDQFDKIERAESTFVDSVMVEKMAYMNLLYYLAVPESMPFVRKVAVESENSQVRERAERVKDRIMRLHPEIK